ncbi:MAG: hydantoinase/oxoprolinase family protein [Burkholderiaceae bacterium]
MNKAKSEIRSKSLTVGVDVGGTFTDIFALDLNTGQVQITKVPSTRPDQSTGFLIGVEQALDKHNAGVASIGSIVHGTTVGTNALLERKVAKTGLITTRGFRDVLEMRRRDRPTTWGLWGTFEPLITRDCRIEVGERTLADGTIRQPVDQAEVTTAADQLLASGCEALCIFFINSYANAENEKQALAWLSDYWPNPHITASHQILPEVREFERASTASLNAALQPVVGNYIASLEKSLAQRNFDGSLLIVQSNGGLMSVPNTRQFPVRTALSGPAAGVISCAHIAQSSGFDNVITGDVGGTSFDVSLIAGNKISQAAQQSIAFGMVVRTPMIEIQTIGAGGGSIARVDASGLLIVGPESAGSDPGPVCYGKRAMPPTDDPMGPTVTDANLVLGRINPQRPIGDLAELNVSLARQAIDVHVAKPLGLGIEAAAEAILTVANANMAGAVRLVSIERGYDPDQFAYMPFGGGGALHVCAMMREVGVARGLIPRYPGVSSALGCAIANMQHDAIQTLNQALDRLDTTRLLSTIDELENQGRNALNSAGVPFRDVLVHTELDMLYQGQTHTVAVPVTQAIQAIGGQAVIAAIQSAFNAAYEQSFGQILTAVPVRVLNLRLTVTGVREKFDLTALAPAAAGDVSETHGSRPVFCNDVWQDTPVIDRLAMPANTTINGPAIFEQPDTTIWLEPGFTAQVDTLGNLIVSVS